MKICPAVTTSTVVVVVVVFTEGNKSNVKNAVHQIVAATVGQTGMSGAES